MHDPVRMREIIYGQADGIKSKFPKRLKNAMGVFSVWLDENVNIPRITRGSVKCQRISADDQVFNVVGVE